MPTTNHQYSPLVSVVIPCHNQGQYLNETVRSVLDSTYPNTEIIIVDDGSTDDTALVARKLVQQHSHIQYIYQENAGPSKARNRGISGAMGKYILPLDSDDLISCAYVSEAVQAFEKKEDLKLVYCEAEKFEGETGSWKLKPFSLDVLAYDNMIFSSAIYRKSDWEKCGGYDENMTWVLEDWEFWISLLKNGGKVKKLPITGFFYRIRSGSRQSGRTDKRIKEFIDYINIKHKDFIFEHLNGPLRFKRTHSKKINTFLKWIRWKG